ncbi:MAG: hypothetical protein A3F72_11440 [Bacteroidetes bacterium RIFCSPLOWO2_12_FULL_35_15]|nr:MAG: hypothetical protein A3F72_11440 [Bacteroidetes bacterium RIFCSPLOWO2_12_FULL_35_15]
MLAKLRLDQTKKYEQALATCEIANMLVDFIFGRKHYLRVGSEQGGIAKWDDIVIEKEQSSQIHIQAKRQTSDFGDKLDECVRNKILSGARKDELRDLSPLDESIKSLADWSKDIDITNVDPKREFWIELPELNTQIKKGLLIRHLKDLCEVQIKPAVTTASGLASQAASETNLKNCFDWLTTWCDFKDWDHILKALQLLKVKNSGTETEIESKTEEKLKEVFISDKVRDVRLKIVSYTNENTTFSGAISPRNLLFELKESLRSDIIAWTQFENSSMQWNISGTQDLEFNSQIERSKVIVPKLWTNVNPSRLKVYAPFNKNCKLSEGLLRIAIHQGGLAMTQFTDKNDWEHNLKSKIGGTLGVSENDTDNLNIIENTEKFLSSENRPLINLANQETDAEELHSNMLLITWEAVKKTIADKIRSINVSHSKELKDAIDVRWGAWVAKLEISPEEQKMLFRNMLHPSAEGNAINGDMRVGLKTVGLLTEGLLLLLIVSVCIDNDGKGDWKKLTDEHLANTIALQYWSGVSGQEPNVKEILNNCGDIIGKENVDLLIFSKIHASPSEVLGLKIGEPIQKENTLAEGKQLKMLVTHNILLRQLIEKGEIQGLRTYFDSMIVKKEKVK